MALSYKEAGVDKEQGYQEVNLIKKFIQKTYTSGVLSDLGGFSGLFELNKQQYEEPVLVSGTDGVGTKVLLAQKYDRHNTVGIDCVAMCVNDILCQGARPLFFLDYIATGKLEAEKMAKIVEGVAQGCLQAKAALIGGETAEMPGLYAEKDYDLAGFCVGIVDKKKIIQGKDRVKEGDVLLGLPSSGIHSNGYSLVRKIIFDYQQLNPETEVIGDQKLIDVLLTPTKIYVQDVLPVLEEMDVHGMAHITGGGFHENIPRILPEGLAAEIQEEAIPKLAIFEKLQEWGDLDKNEMYGTFNMGIGLVLVVSKEEVSKVQSLNPSFLVLGKVVKGNQNVIIQ